jgi:flagellum-specific ATP synthase
MPAHLARIAAEIEALDPRRFEGRVTGLFGALVEASGPVDALALGARATIHGQRAARGEIVGFRGDRALVAPYDSIEAIRPGARVTLEGAAPMARPSRAWLGRVLDCFGQPVDGQGPLPQGAKPRPVRAPPISAHERGRVGARLDVGVRALNLFAAICRGQRMGVFSPVRGSASPYCCRCWRAERPPT